MPPFRSCRSRGPCVSLEDSGGFRPKREKRAQTAETRKSTQIKKFNGNISKTANFIGMDRTALHRKMKDLNIMPNERYRNIIGY